MAGLFALGAAIIIGSVRGWSAVAHFGAAGDGTAGALVALIALCVGAVFIQRLFKRPVAAGFNPDGIYSPTQGWIEWGRVRRIEVRRRGNALTGRRTVVWVAFLGPDGSEEVSWLAFNPGWGESRTLDLAAEMERLWLRPAVQPEVNPASS